MKIQIFITLFITAFASLSANAITYIPNIHENEKASIAASTLFFFGHSTSFWDGNNTGVSVREMIRIAGREKIYKVATISDVMLQGRVAEMHYFSPDEIDFLVPSRAGQHSLAFPNAQSIFISGGNLGRCLCEGIRDIARGWWQSTNSQKVELFLVRDGIYDGYPPFKQLPRNRAVDFVENFFVPSFKCPLQNWFDKPRLAMANTKLELRYDGEWVKDFDLEPLDQYELGSLERTIVVHFIDTAHVPNFLHR
jgi:hypothetical protein